MLHAGIVQSKHLVGYDDADSALKRPHDKAQTRLERSLLIEVYFAIISAMILSCCFDYYHFATSCIVCL